MKSGDYQSPVAALSFPDSKRYMYPFSDELTAQKEITSQTDIGQNNRYSHGIFRLSPNAPEISIYLCTVHSLIGKCIEVHM